jgi:hypothetical protein
MALIITYREQYFFKALLAVYKGDRFCQCQGRIQKLFYVTIWKRESSSKKKIPDTILGICYGFLVVHIIPLFYSQTISLRTTSQKYFSKFWHWQKQTPLAKDNCSGKGLKIFCWTLHLHLNLVVQTTIIHCKCSVQQKIFKFKSFPEQISLL